MIEFGARLSLKDNMFATLQKNLKLQREFSEQVDRTSSSIRGLGSQRATPTITANDKASGAIQRVVDAVATAGDMIATPTVRVIDGATNKVDVIAQKLKNIKNSVTAPVVKLKDNASSKVEKVKQSLKAISSKVFAPIVKVKDSASKLINKIKNTLGGITKKPHTPKIKPESAEAEKEITGIREKLRKIGATVARATVAIKDGATKALSKIGDTLKTLAKGVTIAIGIAGAGATALLKGSLGGGASMEQSIGGVQTLFGADAGAVLANADKAYKTAGLSANEYMETVTSFSASLLQSLGGDTQKASEVADMALIDMADNANKFGTDMGSIQNAYQGFAKQNYTMLDNLKLGYGGTQEEMQRLLKDAKKITGVEYDIKNLSDVYNAIHAIQKNMGIAGATADEAEKTFTGSFNAMKASAQNLLSNLALGGDITGSVEQLIDTASTFLFNNAIPMIGRVFESLPDVISVAIEKGLPKLKQLGNTIVTGLKDGLKSVLPAEMAELVDPAFSSIGNAISKAINTAKSVMQSLLPAVTNIFNTLAPVAEQIGNLFLEIAPVIAETLGNAFGEGGGIVETFAEITSSAIPVVKQVVLSLSQVFNTVSTALKPVLSTLGSMVQMIFPVIQDIIVSFGDIVAQIFPIIASAISNALNAVMPIISALANLIQVALPIVSNVISVVAGVLESVMPVISEIFTDVGGKIARIINEIIVPIVQKLGDIFQKIAPAIQNAVEIVSTVLSVCWDIISPILDIVITVVQVLWSVLDPIITAIVDAFLWLWDVLEPVFSWLSDVLATVGDFIGSIGDWIGGFFGGGDEGSSHAYGLDRVPYDNYPAVLHQGEKVLTRNQADQYERSMSTRGVQLNNALQPLETTLSRDSASGLGSTGQTQEVKELSKAGTTVNIEKLADTVVIEKEADVDKVVEDMVKKFRKLVPNMA